jgi:hypothetical protein
MSWENILKMPMGVDRSDRQKAGQLRIKIKRKEAELAKLKQRLADMNVPPRPRYRVGSTTYQPKTNEQKLSELLERRFAGEITEEEYNAEKEKLS